MSLIIAANGGRGGATCDLRRMFLDETGVATNVVRRYGWAPRGERLVDDAPRRTASAQRSGPMSNSFWCLLLSPNDFAVADNVAAHKVAGASGLRLAPHSPDLNPIEQVSAKLKALRRKATRDSARRRCAPRQGGFPGAAYGRRHGTGATPPPPEGPKHGGPG